MTHMYVNSPDAYTIESVCLSQAGEVQEGHPNAVKISFHVDLSHKKKSRVLFIKMEVLGRLRWDDDGFCAPEPAHGNGLVSFYDNRLEYDCNRFQVFTADFTESAATHFMMELFMLCQGRRLSRLKQPEIELPDDPMI